MKEPFISWNDPVVSKLTTLKVVAMVTLTAAATALGWLLTARFGTIGSYAPLLFVVVANTWLGGLWPALLTQIAGAGTMFTLLSRPFWPAISSSQLWALLGFLVVAKLTMLLLLSLRHSQDLRTTSEQFELIAQVTHDSVWDWNLQTGHVWRSGKIMEIFGCPAEQMSPEISWWRSRIDPQQEGRVWDSLQAAMANGADRWDQEYLIHRKDGSSITISDHAHILRDRKNRAIRVLGGMADISAERRAEERLVHNASHDSLTGIPNREMFFRRLKNSIERISHSKDEVVAVLFVDLDRFKRINDNFGHQVGDQLLIAVSRRLTNYLREGDLAARFGGDEFTILLDGVHPADEAWQIGQRILHGLAVPYRLDGHDVSITASIGIARSDQGSPETLLQQADLAMYQAKRQGRGQCQVFDPALEHLRRMQAQMEGELKQSFKDGSLRLHYQPIVSLTNGALTSFEALLRWQHPRRGLLLPSEILPLTESAGLSIQLGKWVLRETCDRLKNWRDTASAFSLDMNVNLSGAEFIRPALIDEVKHLLNETGIPGESLIIEVTETTIMESNIDAARRLGQLRDMGIRLALDDFGKGHSSLGRLQDFPISILKIDSSFVQQIRSGKRQILDAIIALAHELNLEITAEGVETQEQLIYLRDKGAAKVQGLLFSPAVAPETATELLVNPPWNLEGLLHSVPELSTGIGAS